MNDSPMVPFVLGALLATTDKLREVILIRELVPPSDLRSSSASFKMVLASGTVLRISVDQEAP